VAQKVTWAEPSETTITQVEINRASTLYGTYTVIATIDATDDGEAKTSSNDWVTTYTDTSGTRTQWYKVRFYDETSELYSEYSDPTTHEELIRLCSVEDIKHTINTVMRWTDDQIFQKITDEDGLIYIDFGTPIQAAYTGIGKINDDIQDIYYVGEENIYRVDRVFYGTTTMTEQFLDDSYKVNAKYGMIKFLPVASTGPDLSTNCDVEIQYVPEVFHKLSIYRASKALLEELDTVSGGSSSKELEVVNKRLEMVEQTIAYMYTVHKSSDFAHYDGLYGVNKKHVRQDFNRNNYVGKYGWD